ncbi:hypothetical protein TSUD_20880 [Trifolium subterraneum]|uniref:Uncharacterized protein n=1 Tax=Trifolium subterraneum TaxID=3900 RepID=A0A2Z6NBJ7_TRISU|nr:hypothetical protein TSUD_20880 [Trifolium subterraneum]
MNWLRSEFAAANAIIECLVQHLGVIGESGEYDGVVGAIQQRRVNWNQVLLMQQYYSISEVAYALQQRFEAANVKEGCNSTVDYHGNIANFAVKETRVIDKSEELKFENKVDMNSQNNEQKKDTITNHQSDGILNRPDNSEGSLSSSGFEAACVNEGTTSNSRGLLPVDCYLNDNI